MALKRVLLISGPSRVGHAVRGMELVRRIRERRPGAVVIQAVEPAAAAIARGNGHAVNAGLSTPGAGRLVRLLGPSIGRDLVGSREALRVAWRIKPDLVIVDNLFAAVPLLRALGYPVIFMTDRTAFSAGQGSAAAPGEDADGNAQDAPAPYSAAPVIRLARLLANRTVFLGDTHRISDDRWRRWIERNLLCPGGLALVREPDRRQVAAIRQLYRGRRLITVTAGGTPAGKPLLTAATGAFRRLNRRLGNVSLKLVCGPGLDPAELRREAGQEIPSGLEIAGHLPDLPSYMAASELVIATAGLSTLEEIARTGTPALLVPTADRPEEMLNAAYFGARYGMKRLETDRFGPDRLADSAVRLLKRGRSNGEKVGERPGTGIADDEGMERLLELIEGYL